MSDTHAIRTTGIVVALASEARTLTPHASPGQLATLDDGAGLWLSGMGLTAAQHAAHALVRAGARALAVFGVAGALDPSLSSGTLFCPEHVVDEDGQRYPTDTLWRTSLQQLALTRWRTSGSLLSVREPLLSVAQKSEAYRHFGAAAVDMESVAVAAIARQHALPFISLRAIVDESTDSIPAALNNSVDAWGRPRALGLMAAFCKHPTVLGDLPRLYSRMQSATRALRAAATAAGPALGWRP